MSLYLSLEENIINKLVEKGLITNKSQFLEYLRKNDLEIAIKKIKAVGCGGSVEYVPKKYADKCCTCSEYYTEGYLGNACPKGHETCYNCAEGGPQYDRCTKVDDENEEEDKN